MVVWTEKGTGKVNAGWLPLMVAFLVGVVSTAAVHWFVLNPSEAQAKPPAGKPAKKPARRQRVPQASITVNLKEQPRLG